MSTPMWGAETPAWVLPSLARVASVPAMRRRPGSPIRYWREQRGLTAAQLGHKAGTTQQQITKLENSQRRLTADWQVKLASALGVKPSDLLPVADAGQTEDEVRLLAAYRRLSPDDRERLIKMAIALAPSRDS